MPRETPRPAPEAASEAASGPTPGAAPAPTSRQPGAHPARAALGAAFPLTVPILAGFLLTGITCGVFAVLLGLPWWMPTFMSIAIFAGSAEFIVATMLTGAFDPVSAFVTILIVNARHLFYGLSLLDRFRAVGPRRLYLIYALCDETFSLEFASHPPAGVDDGWFMFWISALNQAYWVAGCTAGALFGTALPLGLKGVSFAMTALFVVIFLDQWVKEESHAGSLVGLAAASASLAAFGPDGFIVPALALILVGVTAARRWVEPAYTAEDGAPTRGEDRP